MSSLRGPERLCHSHRRRRARIPDPRPAHLGHVGTGGDPRGVSEDEEQPSRQGHLPPAPRPAASLRHRLRPAGTSFGLVPGLPTGPLFRSSSGLTGARSAYGLNRTERLKRRRQASDRSRGAGHLATRSCSEQREKRIQAQKMQEGQSQQMLPVVTPIALEVAGDLIPLVEDAKARRLASSSRR